MRENTQEMRKSTQMKFTRRLGVEALAAAADRLHRCRQYCILGLCPKKAKNGGANVTFAALMRINALEMHMSANRRMP